MGRKFWGGFGLFAAVVAGAGAAGAADLTVQAPVYKAPVILSDWAGFYVGVNGGYGWGSTSFDAPFGIANAKPEGWLVGGHAGYNWQYGAVVTGLEVDFDGADIKDSGVVASFPAGFVVATFNLRTKIIVWDTWSLSRQAKFDELATARARLGYLVLPQLLAYGTGGAAWGHSSLTGGISSSFWGSTSAEASASNFGWVAGAGLEYKVWGNLIARAEYLHYDFENKSYSFPLFSPSGATSIDVTRAGLSYKF
jgi:outer membrane immunogenic protein